MGDTLPVAETLGAELRDHEQSLAVAESCTGGLVGSLVTDVPGSSDYFVGGTITYRTDTKLHDLAVTRERLERHGAVSEPVAREMAQHVRDVTESTWGVSTTGFAGPTADPESVPVGTVYLGVAYAGPFEDEASYATVERHQFEGTRTEVKAKIARRALRAVLSEIRSME